MAHSILRTTLTGALVTLLATGALACAPKPLQAASVAPAPVVAPILPATDAGLAPGTLSLDVEATFPPDSKAVSAEVAVSLPELAAPVVVGNVLLFPSQSATQGYAFDLKNLPTINEKVRSALFAGRGQIEVSLQPNADAGAPVTLKVLESTFAE